MRQDDLLDRQRVLYAAAFSRGVPARIRQRRRASSRCTRSASNSAGGVTGRSRHVGWVRHHRRIEGRPESRASPGCRKCPSRMHLAGSLCASTNSIPSFYLRCPRGGRARRGSIARRCASSRRARPKWSARRSIELRAALAGPARRRLPVHEAGAAFEPVLGEPAARTPLLWFGLSKPGRRCCRGRAALLPTPPAPGRRARSGHARRL